MTAFEKPMRKGTELTVHRKWSQNQREKKGVINEVKSTAGARRLQSK